MDRAAIFLLFFLFNVPINLRWSLSNFGNGIPLPTSVYGDGFAWLDSSPIPRFAARRWFLLFWKTVLQTLNAPLLNEVLCPTEVLACLANHGFEDSQVTADGHVSLWAVGRERALRREGAGARSALLPTSGNRRWRLLRGGTDLASSPSCGEPPSGKKHDGWVTLPGQCSCPTFQDVSWIFLLPFFFFFSLGTFLLHSRGRVSCVIFVGFGQCVESLLRISFQQWTSLMIYFEYLFNLKMPFPSFFWQRVCNGSHSQLSPEPRLTSGLHKLEVYKIQ